MRASSLIGAFLRLGFPTRAGAGSAVTRRWRRRAGQPSARPASRSATRAVVGRMLGLWLTAHAAMIFTVDYDVCIAANGRSRIAHAAYKQIVQYIQSPIDA